MVNNHGELVSSVRIGLWDPFQMTMSVSWFVSVGDQNYLLTDWDDPPSGANKAC